MRNWIKFVCLFLFIYELWLTDVELVPPVVVTLVGWLSSNASSVLRLNSCNVLVNLLKSSCFGFVKNSFTSYKRNFPWSSPKIICWPLCDHKHLFNATFPSSVLLNNGNSESWFKFHISKRPVISHVKNTLGCTGDQRTSVT